jgi:polygalacturonase
MPAPLLLFSAALAAAASFAAAPPTPCAAPALAPGAQHAAANTAVLQASIDSCGRTRDGGVVLVLAGTFSVGCLQLRSQVELRLGVTYSTAATLLASTNRSLYSRGCAALLSSSSSGGRRLHNVSLSGLGVIDGTAASAAQDARGGLLIKLVHLSNITGLRLEAVTVRNSPSWHVHLCGCDDVIVTGVNIWGPEERGETDGLDLDTCHRVYVSRVDIGTGDDAIAIKSSGAGATSDVLIEHATLRRKEMAFGSSANCRNVTIRHQQWAIGSLRRRLVYFVRKITNEVYVKRRLNNSAAHGYQAQRHRLGPLHQAPPR